MEVVKLRRHSKPIQNADEDSNSSFDELDFLDAHNCIIEGGCEREVILLPPRDERILARYNVVN
ncbi:hypothetical protein KDA11_01725 [Candidatus Saccharibacteria bacterium]|nr:hypothetical protein [Candidatus Saccharibacteria bacterium]